MAFKGTWITIGAVGFVVAIVLAFVTAYVLVVKKPIFSTPSVEPLEECNTLYFSGQNKINLVFFATQHTASEYMDVLVEYAPFKREDFNVYYIPSYVPECELYKGIALLCYSKEIIKKASSCPSDFIVTTQEVESDIRSSSYLNAVSINEAQRKSVFAHESGHAIAALAEEYVPALLPRNAKNCAEKCDNFGVFKDGCFLGCSRADYLRSVENGIMRTLNSKKFGIFNENLISERIIESTKRVGITGSAVASERDCKRESYYLLEGIYDKSEQQTRILRRSAEIGCLGNGFGDSRFILRDVRGQLIVEGDFNPDLIFTDYEDVPETGDLKGETFVNDVDEIEVLLKVPIVDERAELIIEERGRITTETKIEMIELVASNAARVQSILDIITKGKTSNIGGTMDSDDGVSDGAGNDGGGQITVIEQGGISRIEDSGDETSSAESEETTTTALVTFDIEGTAVLIYKLYFVFIFMSLAMAIATIILIRRVLANN